MEREPVDSSCVASCGYDPESDDLEIEFTDGTVYTYYNVSGHQFSRMLRSPSVGWYFNRYIRGNYAYSGG
jgi:hypothetical protein